MTFLRLVIALQSFVRARSFRKTGFRPGIKSEGKPFRIMLQSIAQRDAVTNLILEAPPACDSIQSESMMLHLDGYMRQGGEASQQ